MKTIGHHTVENKNNDEFIRKNGPFKSENEKNYLGKGYYFWDNNFHIAKWWGRKHYNNRYIVCEAYISLDKPYFFNLVGSREDILHFNELVKYVKKVRGDWPIGKIIEFLWNRNKESGFESLFPFNIIRVVDNKFNKYKKKFEINKTGFMNLDPVYIICIKENPKQFVSDFCIKFKEN